jgi:hypothetical protein
MEPWMVWNWWLDQTFCDIFYYVSRPVVNVLQLESYVPQPLLVVSIFSAPFMLWLNFRRDLQDHWSLAGKSIHV